MPPDTRSDRVQRFREIYDLTYPKVMAYALRRARSREDGLDVVSESFAVIWRKLEVVPDDDRLLGYVYGVARRVLANHYRAITRKKALAERLALERPGTDDYRAFEVVHEALAGMRADDVEILTLSAWDRLDNSEIGVALGLSAKVVAVRLHRARRRLARRLADLGLTPGNDQVKSSRPDRTPGQVNSGRDRRKGLEIP